MTHIPHKYKSGNDLIGLTYIKGFIGRATHTLLTNETFLKPSTMTTALCSRPPIDQEEYIASTRALIPL
eukprot:11508048-Karenia_brevis.AAC.1